jgi:hypothetical protein
MKLSALLPLFVVAGVLTFEAAGIAASPTQTNSPTPTSPPASGTEAMYSAAAKSADSKFQKIETNGQKSQPDQTPIVFTENEINAYVASGAVKLPEGIDRLRFSGTQQSITTNATIDFDKVTEGKASSNPMMGLFSGVHEVQIVSHGHAAGGQAEVVIDSVSLDGVRVPRMALEYFANHYIKPKYPDLGLDSRFELPDRIDTATVGNHVLTITQK